MKQDLEQPTDAKESSGTTPRKLTKKLSTAVAAAKIADVALPVETGSFNESKLIAKVEELFCAVTGTRGKALAGRILAQLQSLQIGEPDLDRRLCLAFELLAELRPTSALQSLLAVQMFGVHEAANLFLRNAIAEHRSPEGRDANLARSTKLMGLFLQQLEALQKLKGKATQQKVTVEHVHIHEGGKAIVGAVSTSDKSQEESE